MDKFDVLVRSIIEILHDLSQIGVSIYNGFKYYIFVRKEHVNNCNTLADK